MENLHRITALLHNTIRVGQVLETDEANALVRIKCGDNTTDWLPMPASIGRNYIAWSPMRVGQAVVLACPSGDLAQACIVGSGYTKTINAPAQNPDKDLIQFNDGTRIEYDSKTQELILYSVKNIRITAANHLTLTASHTFIASPVTQTGGDMTSDGISVQHHTHPQNSGDHFGGGTNTDKPA